MELRSHVAGRRSPASPEQRSKWRVRIGGWCWPYAVATEPFSTLLNTTSPACLFLRRVRGHAPSNNRLRLRSSCIRNVTHQCRKTGASAAEVCEANVSLQPPQFAECVSCCIKQHILRSGRPAVNSKRRGIKDEGRTEAESVCVSAAI